MEKREIVSDQKTSTGLHPDSGHDPNWEYNFIMQQAEDEAFKGLNSPINLSFPYEMNHREKILADINLLLNPEKETVHFLKSCFDTATNELKKISRYHHVRKYNRHELSKRIVMMTYGMVGRGLPGPIAERNFKELINQYWLAFYWSDLAEWIRIEIKRHEKHQNISEGAETPNLQKPKSATNYSSFVELFFSADDLKNAVGILQKISADRKFNIIDSNGRWLGRDRDGSRSVLLAWVEALQLRGWFKYKITNLQMSELLNNYFIGLNLSTTDDSLWRKQKNSSTANSYNADFLQFIKKR